MQHFEQMGDKTGFNESMINGRFVKTAHTAENTSGDMRSLAVAQQQSIKLLEVDIQFRKRFFDQLSNVFERVLFSRGTASNESIFDAHTLTSSVTWFDSGEAQS
jgi:hypothetical protein